MSLLSATSAPFQLLEINLISAQDLAPLSKPTKAYAVLSLPPHRKLTTQIDHDGDTSPTWNEKFVFRVDQHFLHDDNSTIIIDIYASAWLRDILIGTVGVLLRNLLPPSSRSGNRKSKLQFVALQIRRPSGRPRGILNIGVNLVDSTKRSMPLYSELSASAVGDYDFNPVQKTPQKDLLDPVKPKLLTLQRSQSEKNDSTINDYVYHPTPAHKKQGSGYNEGSEIGVQPPRGVIVNANGSLCSDVGPSPSVVAAAIAKGLYPVPLTVTQSSGLDEWSEKNNTEGMKTKIERWKTELPPVYDHMEYRKLKQSSKRNTKARNRNGLFSCFGTAMGCEFSITCGGGNRKKKYGAGKSQLTQSELTYDESSYM
ncbi:uncharacterized protein LOC129305667 [Prosopis cineraria]|uniref:uncharacterized protein LOC129305667 n=1 Tax=Prosopis cineraria TaxID=364024 RepID=UPI0024100E7E|nr:uncharacterized protein LOC129305667 [Prosopis cineraria]